MSELDYFRPHSPWLWHWEESGEIVTWGSGPVITFHPELAVVLERLRPLRLPRFGAIVLLLAACRESWGEAGAGRQSLVEFLWHFHEANAAFQAADEVIRGLDNVHALRDQLTWPARKAELAALVFEEAEYRQSRVDTEAILQQFSDGLLESHVSPRPEPSFEHLVADFFCLRSGLRKLNAETLCQRLATGLDQGVNAAELDLPPGEAIRVLLRDLAEDDQLGGVLRLARQLSAAVQLPRSLHVPEENSLGGVSDIANRGELDQLLLSELVHDDLTLAVRVALNEALYLRYEAAARPRDRQRLVLLDVGLRMWGLPRVYATAVGLAVAAQADAHTTVATFRAVQDGIEPIDFTTARGLTAQLAALDHNAHPGKALPAFVERAKAFRAEATDLLLITTDAVLGDQEFQQALAAQVCGPWHVATVNRGGEFQLTQRSAHGAKPLRSAKLDLDQILSRPPHPVTRPLAELDDSDLPAIFGAQPFPLRLSVPVRVENSWLVHPHGVLTLAPDGRLLLWDIPQRGARELLVGLPPGRIQTGPLWSDGEEITLVLGKRSRRGLYVLRFSFATRDYVLRRLELSADSPQAVAVMPSEIAVLYQRGCDVLSPITGELLATHRDRETLQVRTLALIKRLVAANKSRRDKQRPQIVDSEGALQISFDPDDTWVEADLFAIARPRQLRSRFRGILVDEQRRLVLVSPRESYWPMQFDGRHRAITLPSTPLRSRPQGDVVPFHLLDDSGQRRFELSLAQWPDQSRAVLDSRGLLHLRSSDRSLPECTIVLDERETAGWTSDGRYWGPRYFLPEGATPTLAHIIWSEVLKPFITRLP